MDNNQDVVTELAELDCWELLREQEFGRLAFHLVNEVHIVPINYAVSGERLVFRTAEGSKLLGITMNHDVAFEIDQYDEDHATSVVVRGTARELEGDEADIAEQLPLRPWVPTAKFSIVEIRPTEVTGRKFRLDRPWSHMHPKA
jgi:nitroimidazol reductase NimA-like FMN-containing flavoprotein (pyridoxamine 5'-phosphate oxidase superfamily)